MTVEGATKIEKVSHPDEANGEVMHTVTVFILHIINNYGEFRKF